MKLCEVCNNNEAVASAILGEQFYKYVCSSCKSGKSKVSSGHARWSRGIDAEDREADIQQPYGADGLPNRKFIQLYPDKARHHFTEAEIRRYG